MLNECQISSVLWGHPIAVAPIPIVLSKIPTPVLQRERRVGDHPIKTIDLSVLHMLRVTKGVALPDVGTDDAVQEHVHTGNR